MLISYVYNDVKIIDDDQLHLHLAQFDGRADVPEQCRMHRPMEGVRSYSRSHWMPPLGEYSCQITPAADRHSKQKTFWWLWWCTGAILHPSPNGGGPGLQWKPLVNAIGWVLQPMIAIGQQYTGFLFFFQSQLAEIGVRTQVTPKPVVTTGVWHIKLMILMGHCCK